MSVTRRWENGGAIYAHAHLVTPASPELYARIGPRYPAAWNRDRTK